MWYLEVQIKKMKNSAAIWFAKMKVKDGPSFSEHLLDCKVWIIVTYSDVSFFH
jgi:hypothetical protein